MSATSKHISRSFSLLDKVACARYTTSYRWVNPTYLKKLERAARRSRMVEMEPSSDYTSWSNEQLVARVTQLEQALKSKNARYAFSCIVLTLC